MEKSKHFAVLGGGSWATAIVKMLTENVMNISWYMRSEDSIAYLKKHHHNPNYLSSVAFDMNQLQLSSDINEVVDVLILLLLPFLQLLFILSFLSFH